MNCFQDDTLRSGVKDGRIFAVESAESHTIERSTFARFLAL